MMTFLDIIFLIGYAIISIAFDTMLGAAIAFGMGG